MKRILYISDGNEFGGIERLEVSYFEQLKNKYDISILTSDKDIFKSYEKELDNHLYSLDIKRNSFIHKIKYNNKLYKFLKENDFDIIHINSSVFLYSFFVVFIAKKCNIKKIIVHSHSIPKMSFIKKIIMKILNPYYKKMVDVVLSCSEEASTSLVLDNKDVKIINNGVDINTFKFNNKNRNKIRKELNINNNKVYGNIARFDKVKNHNMLIDIFYNIYKKDNNSILLLIGDGSELNNIKNKVKELNIEDKVIFLGYKKDIEKYLSAMDIFIFTSIREGFGISLLEAQTNGLICYSSDIIPRDVNINNIRLFKLDDSIDDIVNRIIKEKDINNKREDAYKIIINSKFNIEEICKILDTIYS